MPVAKEESRGERQRYCSREPSRYPSPPPFCLATKPGLAREPSTRPSPPPFHLATNPSRAPSIASVDKLDVEPASRIYPSLPPSPLFSSRAPSASLDKSGFEPASHTVNTVCTDACSFFLLVSLVLQQRQATKAVLMTKIIPPTPAAPHFFSPSPAASPGPSHTLTAPDSTKTSSATVSDKGDQGFVMGRVPDSVIVILTEGFDEVDISLSKLAACVNMPFHQVVDRYHHTHTHTPLEAMSGIYMRGISPRIRSKSSLVCPVTKIKSHCLSQARLMFYSESVATSSSRLSIKMITPSFSRHGGKPMSWRTWSEAQSLDASDSLTRQ